MTIVSVAVVAFFARREHYRAGTWQSTIAASLSAIILGAILVITLQKYHVLLGVESTSPWRWTLPAAFALAALFGTLRAWWMRERHPDRYHGIGLGVNSPMVSPVVPTAQGAHAR